MWRPRRWARDTDADGERPPSTNLWQSNPSEVASIGLASSSPPGVDFANLLAAGVRCALAEAGGRNDAEDGCRHGRARQAAGDGNGLNQSVERRRTEGKVRS